MANSGTFYTSGYPDDGSGAPYRFKFSWSLTGQSIEGNYSTISWSVVCDGGRTSNYFIYIYEKYVTVNGSSQSRNYEEKIFSGTTVFSGSATIYHSADGSGSFAANCGGSFYSSGSYNSSGSGSWVLPTIPRSCSIDKIGNITGAGISSINTGNDIRIYFTPKTTSFSYRTTVSIGSNSSTNTGTVSNTNQTYRQYNIPHSWLPNGTSGTLTCKLETLNGSTIIGTSTKTITINVDSSVIPTTSGIVATYVSAGNSVVDSWGIYVQNKSKVKITLNGVTAGSGSGIKSCSISGPNVPSNTMSVSGSTATSTTNVLGSNGTLTYSAYATDNRGRNSTARSVNITCYPYSNISISSLRVDRCLANGTISQDGKYAKCTFSGSCASVNGKNKVDSSSSKFYYKEKGASTWTALSAVNSVSGVSIVGGNFDISKEYEIRLIVKDLVGSSATVYGKLDTAERVFNIAKYGNGLAVGKMSTVSDKSADGKFECGWDASFDKNVSVNGKTLIDLIYPIGSIYMSVNNVSPQAFFGGTWEQIQNRFLLAAGSSYTAGSTGGEATHKLTMDEMPAHQGHMYDNFDSSGYVDRGGDTNSYYVNSSASGYATYENRPYKVVSGNEFVMQGYTRGGSAAHNNMPPYLAVYIWKRTK
nr:MAG TPA: baseplate protein [Bacteriophage sp.]